MQSGDSGRVEEWKFEGAVLCDLITIYPGNSLASEDGTDRNFRSGCDRVFVDVRAVGPSLGSRRRMAIAESRTHSPSTFAVRREQVRERSSCCNAGGACSL